MNLGCVLLVEALWQRIGIQKTLNKIIGQKRVNVLYERALLAMCANRLCEPESKLGVWDRWLSKVYLSSFDGLNIVDQPKVLKGNTGPGRAMIILILANGISVPTSVSLSAIATHLKDKLLLPYCKQLTGSDWIFFVSSQGPKRIGE